MDLAVIGAGRVGTAIAVLLARAGHRVAAVSGREGTTERAARFLPGVPVLAETEATRDADVVLLGVPDAAIEATAGRVAPALRSRATVVHLSGALGLAALRSAEAAGATPIALHPLQTFPTVESAVERMPGSAAAVTARTEEAFAIGEGLARDAGARPFRLADEARPLYHAGAVLASNAVVALVALAERVVGEAGVDDPVGKFLPLTRAAVESVDELGVAGALTGPVVRGDAETVERNLRALGEHAPEAVAAYVALASASSALAAGSGRLSERGRAAVEEVLARWR